MGMSINSGIHVDRLTFVNCGHLARRFRSIIVTEVEQFFERLSELSTHAAVEQEIDGAVDQDDEVEDVAERNVDSEEDGLFDSAEEGEDALRELGHDEHEHDSHQHGSRPVVLPGLLRLFAFAL